MQRSHSASQCTMTASSEEPSHLTALGSGAAARWWDGPARALPAAAVGLGWFALNAVALQAIGRLAPQLAAVVLVIDLVSVVWVARRGAVVVAIPMGTMSVVALDWYAIPPTHAGVVPDLKNAVALAAYLVTGTLLGQLAASVSDRARTSERARAELADEHAALRRVATAVARQDSSGMLFDLVVREAQDLLDADTVTLLRYGPDETVTVLADVRRTHLPLPVGTTLSTVGDNVASRVRRSEAPASMDDYTNAGGGLAARMRELGVQSSVACPVNVNGALWGVMVAASTTAADPLAPATRSRIAEFTDLVATAIANAESRTELRESRARVVARGDEIRRQLERDLHDGVQQRLVSLALHLRMARDRLATEPEGAAESLAWVQDELSGVVDDLRELSHGIHPAILSSGGLAPAVATLARRTPILVDTSVGTLPVVPEPVQVGAYYVVAEALTNAVKHAQASRVSVRIDVDDDASGEGALAVSVEDDGVGGASVGVGSGLIGLRDRVAALGGRLDVTSPRGAGTSLVARIPLAATLH